MSKQDYCWKKAIVNNVAAAEAAAAEAEAQRGNVIVLRSQQQQEQVQVTTTGLTRSNIQVDPGPNLTENGYCKVLFPIPRNNLHDHVDNCVTQEILGVATVPVEDQDPVANGHYECPKNSTLATNSSTSNSIASVITASQQEKTIQINDSNNDAETVEPKKSRPSFTCPHCPKKFRHKSYFDYHLRTHTGERPFKCHLCPKSFFERSKLNRHLSSCHHIRTSSFYEVGADGAVQEKLNTCPICHKTFSRAESLQTHISSHHQGSRPFKCPKCSKGFSGRTALKNHEKSHQGDKSEVCTICSKSFLLKKYLNLHMNTVHKQQPKNHACGHCRKGFYSEKDLKRHQLMHSSAKNFACTHCDTSFKRKDNLNRHLKLSHPELSQATSSDSPQKSDESIVVIYERPVAAPAITTVHPAVNQVSVIKSTHEVMMSITRGQQLH